MGLSIRAALCAALFSLALGACVPIQRSVNHPLDTSQLGQFQAGTSTMSDVERVYGAPAEKVTNSQDGHTVLVYAYSHVAGEPVFGSTRVQHQGVVFVFDANGVLLNYRVSAGAGTVH